MKRKNISLCAIAATMLVGNGAYAMNLTAPSDNTTVINEACKAAAYKLKTVCSSPKPWKLKSSVSKNY